jgi:hypothetical protein
MPCRQSVSISGGMPSMRYSRGTPIRKPRMSPVSAASKSGTGRSAEVESFGSWPAMEPSMMAASRTSRASGPAWSSEEENATTPQREQRP